MFFDTHAHYDDEQFNSDRDVILNAMQRNQVSLIVNAGCHIESSRFSVELAQKYPFIYAAVGVHPHSAYAFDDAQLEEIQTMAKKEKVVALGEIGLDYYYNFSTKEDQRRTLEAQLELSCQLKLPVIIHDREAHEDTLKMLREHKAYGVVHCFSGSVEMAKSLLDLGWYLSFNGAITFKNAKKALDVIESMPFDRLLIETDCPYLTPVPFRSYRNDSTYLHLTAEKIAELKHMQLEEVAAQTMQNGKTLFGIS